VLRERDWDNVLWNVPRGRSVLFVGPEHRGRAEPVRAGLAQLARVPTLIDRRRGGKAA
jgi:hypothetical protein